MMTSSAACPSASRRAATVRACHSASALPRVPSLSGVTCISQRASTGRDSGRSSAPTRSSDAASSLRETEQPVERIRVGHGSIVSSSSDFSCSVGDTSSFSTIRRVTSSTRARASGGQARRASGRRRCSSALADRLEPLPQGDDGRDDVARTAASAANRAASSSTMASARGELGAALARGSPSRSAAGRRCCRGRPAPGRRPTGSTSRGTAMSMMKSGRCGRGRMTSCTQPRVRTAVGRRSPSRRCRRRPARRRSSDHGTARPPRSAASASAVGARPARDDDAAGPPAPAGARRSASPSRPRRAMRTVRPLMVAEDLPGERDGRVADRHGAFAEAGFARARACRRRRRSGTAGW